MGKISRSGSGMNIPDHISESSGNKCFWVKILLFFVVDADADPGSGNLFDPGSGMGKFISGINIPDPQHCSSSLLHLLYSSNMSRCVIRYLNLPIQLTQSTFIKNCPHSMEY
jgi:hypothetical protein